MADEQSDYTAARTLAEESLATRRELGNRLGLTQALEVFAAIAGAHRQPERALRLAASAAAGQEELGSPYSSVDQASLNRWLGSSRQVLYGEATTRAWAQGHPITLEQAIAYALDTEDESRSYAAASA